MDDINEGISLTTTEEEIMSIKQKNAEKLITELIPLIRIEKERINNKTLFTGLHDETVGGAYPYENEDTEESNKYERDESTPFDVRKVYNNILKPYYINKFKSNIDAIENQDKINGCLYVSRPNTVNCSKIINCKYDMYEKSCVIDEVGGRKTKRRRVKRGGRKTKSKRSGLKRRGSKRRHTKRGRKTKRS